MKDIDFNNVYEQYFLRAAFTRVKSLKSTLLLEQGLYLEHEKLQTEILKETDAETLVLAFLTENREIIDKNTRGENGLLPS